MNEEIICRRDGEPPFHMKACCYVHRIEYDFDKRVGKFYLDNGCTDMTGVIDLFMAIDQGAQLIFTIDVDGRIDTTYRRGNRGAWIAIDGLNQ